MNDTTVRSFLGFITRIAWGRFWLISLLALIAAGLLTALVGIATFGTGAAPVMPLFLLLWVGVLIARIILRGHPEYRPEAAHKADEGDDIPAPTAGWARASWFLARLSWPRFFLICVLFLATAGILSSLVAPKHQRSDTPTAPVEIQILHDKDKKGQEVTSVIRVGPDGVETTRRKPVGTARGGDEVRIDSQGIRIEKKDGSGEIVTIGPGGITVHKRDGSAAKTIDLPGIKISVDDGAKPAASAPAVPAPPAAPAPPQASAAEASAPGDAPADEDTDADPDAPRPKVVTIDPASGEAISKQLERALKKAHASIEGQIREELDRQYADERIVNWDEVVMIFAFALVIMTTILKLMAGSQYRARVAAYRAMQRAEGEALQRQLSEAQLKAMQAQVEPHFLFNTLASVDYLIETDPKRASTMQKNLISWLRAALPQMREASTTLGRELKLATSYLEILKVRMEERLSYSVEVPEGLYNAEFPPMMLQTLVENAIKHGLEPKPEGGSVTIRAQVQDGMLRVTVGDTGVGLSATGAAATRGTGLGLSNIRDRLAMLYPGKARLVLEANSPSGTLASIEIPYKNN
jgi:signal transduction histidine kinase